VRCRGLRSSKGGLLTENALSTLWVAALLLMFVAAIYVVATIPRRLRRVPSSRGAHSRTLPEAPRVLQEYVTGADRKQEGEHTLLHDGFPHADEVAVMTAMLQTAKERAERLLGDAQRGRQAALAAARLELARASDVSHEAAQARLRELRTELGELIARRDAQRQTIEEHRKSIEAHLRTSALTPTRHGDGGHEVDSTRDGRPRDRSSHRA
jgi:hypothetical protein